MSGRLLIRNCVAVSPSGRTACSILVEDGVIVAVLQASDHPAAEVTVEAAGRYVIPGAIDTHVHLGLAGQTFAQDCLSESQSAVTGGTTAFLQYLVNPGPQGSYLEVYRGYADAVRACSLVDIGFHARMQTPQHVGEIPRYVDELHITSFKFIRSDPVLLPGQEGYSGIPDDLFLEGLQTVARMEGCTAIVHCENRDIIQRSMRDARQKGGQRLLDWSHSRPACAEVESIQSSLFWAAVAKAPVMIAHMSVAEGAGILQRCRRQAAVFGEACPQYLVLNHNMPLGALGKCAPPVRTEADCAALWKALARGVLDCVGSDHCAYTAAYKGSDMWSAYMGLPGTGVILPILLGKGVNEGRLSLERLVAVTSYNAARIFGFYPRKGSITVGADADLVLLDMEREVTIEPELLNSVVDYSPYSGLQLRGWPLLTIVRGRVVAEAGRVVDSTVRGRCLEHGRFQA